jgi:hypothetical protein
MPVSYTFSVPSWEYVTYQRARYQTEAVLCEGGRTSMLRYD